METLKLDWDVHAAGLAVLTLNRPTALNAMNTQMMKELLNLFREQAYNDELR
jgi:enoyl-CoA hydratase